MLTYGRRIPLPELDYRIQVIESSVCVFVCVRVHVCAPVCVCVCVGTHVCTCVYDKKLVVIIVRLQQVDAKTVKEVCTRYLFDQCPVVIGIGERKDTSILMTWCVCSMVCLPATPSQAPLSSFLTIIELEGTCTGWGDSRRQTPPRSFLALDGYDNASSLLHIAFLSDYLLSRWMCLQSIWHVCCIVHTYSGINKLFMKTHLTWASFQIVMHAQLVFDAIVAGGNTVGGSWCSMQSVHCQIV